MNTTAKQTNSEQEWPLSVGLFYQQRLTQFTRSIVEELTALMDVRLVRTFSQLLITLLRFRHRNNGLLLSELGEHLLSARQAPAGTKRISNLLRCPHWSHTLIQKGIRTKAQTFYDQLHQQGQRVLILWDESVMEKPETLASEDLAAVRSSKARRLKRIRPGYFNPPDGKPICVPGLEWVGILLAGTSGAPCLYKFEWWTRRGEHARQRTDVLDDTLSELTQRFGQTVLHVFDRGYASQTWLGKLLTAQLKGLIRWQTHYRLLHQAGESIKTWEITRGKRSVDHRLVYDAVQKCYRKMGIIYQPVRHPAYPDVALYLIVSRPGKGRTPWYLLTNEVIDSVEAAWQMVFAYARRWQIETAFRYSKSELALESPRLWFWENRLKLMMIVALLYAFLLSLLRAELSHWQQLLLRLGCHRTGKRCREASAPLYRIRIAFTHLWSQNSG
ncbi:transposase [Spirosoma luteum]|uniref:transposase n=1 Tax=Spirosoma luteum TaxID=431553 RepID=UPI0003814CA4|nr:transposase [Spirosoma luteum]